MFLIRAVELKDVPLLRQFAHKTALGMQSLPRTNAIFIEKIDKAVEAFKKGGPFYLFVLEEIESGKVVGCAGIYTQSATCSPYLFFRIERRNSPSPPLCSQLLLHPEYLHNGPSELCALYLLPSYRKKGLGKLLSQTRYLFIASFKENFQKELMARLRGVIHGRNSPFWKAVGQHFVDLSFAEAEKLIEKNSPLLSQMLPEYPIYADLLTKRVQALIGRSHPTTEPAQQMLKSEGFDLSDRIDFFDAGGVMVARTDQVQTIQRARVAKIADILPLKDAHVLIANRSLNFRACLGSLKTVGPGKVIVEEKAAKLLHLSLDQEVCYVG